MARQLRTLLSGLAAVLGVSAATADECQPQWLYGPHQGMTGLDGYVYALTVYDDGGGPALYAAGRFTTAGQVLASNVAKWDGVGWAPLGTGVYGTGVYDWVSATTVYNGELIAAGRFVSAGGVTVNHIALWDGIRWAPLGSGMNDPVYALTVYNGELIAAGFFTTAGGISADRIARWDGLRWAPLGSGIGGLTYPAVYALSVYKGELIVGGKFTTAGGVSVNQIARWDGNTWAPLGSGMAGTYSPHVYELTVYAGELIAGGGFTTAGGVSANRIARWDGSRWAPLGSGMWREGPFDPQVSALTVYNAELVAGGTFTIAGGTSANRIARWDGERWAPLDSGVGGATGIPFVGALALYNGELIAGGGFTTAGGQVSAYWARWGCPYGTGDLNCDGDLDAFDIEPFILALTDPAGYAAAYPNCDRMLADINGDEIVNAIDIEPFVELLVGP